MNFQNIIFEKDKGIAKIIINRPEKRNALNRETRMEILEVLNQARKDETARVLIFRGTGEESFIAGADVNVLKPLSPLEMFHYMNHLGQQLYNEIDRFPIPTIALINGHCYGGGVELALACDIRIASENAKFGQTEILLGFIPGGGATQKLPRLIGSGLAKELIFTGKVIDAREAERIGLVNRAVPLKDLDGEGLAIAEKICSLSPIAIRLCKEAINHSAQTALNPGLAYEIMAETLCFSTEDHLEGIQAFLEKRKAEFKGR
ncbi:MAG: enoyl-CoA hydratase-related protein [Thermodesulfobacteriota bacterium]|nr:enoyl-CoA hydratase-related protein [Thermodesulfobacteriota bacterium]